MTEPGAAARSRLRTTLIDLTLPMGPDMIQNHPMHPPSAFVFINQRHDLTQHFFDRHWTGDLPPAMDGLPDSVRTPSYGHGWQTEHLLLGSHAGAHIDAAAHYDPESDQDAAKIPLEQCYGPAVLLDLWSVYAEKRAITASDLDSAEERASVRVGEGDIVLINTGHAAKYAYSAHPDRRAYTEDYPGFDHEAPQWFIDRGIKLLGIDTVNPDLHPQASMHVNFLMRGQCGKPPILIVENLVHLEDIPVPRFTFIGFPLPIVGASGSPLRAVAVVESD